jgi:hypothetical protein
MDKKYNSVINITVSISIVLGIMINNLITDYFNINPLFNYILTFILSSFVYNVLYNIFVFSINHINIFLKLYWKNEYLKGFWFYSYDFQGQKRYGLWCVSQNIENIEIEGFGISNDQHRTEHQAITPLIKDNLDYYVIIKRRNLFIDDAQSLEEEYYKILLKFYSRNTIFGICNYPIKMTGITTKLHGGDKENWFAAFEFIKERKIKSTEALENKIRIMISNDNQDKTYE